MSSSKKQKKHKVFVPKGMSCDGESYYCEDNIVNLDGKVCIKDLPVGDIPFMLDPDYGYNHTMDKYKGQLIPIYTVNHSGTKWFKCKHVLKEDQKTGVPLAFCTKQWKDNQFFNIGSVQEHTWHSPWMKRGWEKWDSFPFQIKTSSIHF